MVLSRSLIIGLVAVALVACERKPNTEYTVTGIELGPIDFHEIQARDSKVSFVGDDPAKRREAETLKDRYKERITLKNNATIDYSRMYFIGFTGRDSDAEMVKTAVSRDFYKEMGIVFDLEKTKKSGQLTYLLQSSESYRCFVGHSFFGVADSGRPGNQGNQEISVSKCYSAGAKTLGALEQEMLDILARAQFDDGAGNKARYAESIPQKPEAAAAADLPPPQALALLEGRWTNDDCAMSYSEFTFNDVSRTEARYNYVNLVGTRANIRNVPVNVSIVGDNIVLNFPGLGGTTTVRFKNADLRETVDIDRTGRSIPGVYRRCAR